MRFHGRSIRQGYFSDESTQGKMPDCDPLELFEFHGTLVLYEPGENISEFIDLFAFG
jgi:hypothetical protein